MEIQTPAGNGLSLEPSAGGGDLGGLHLALPGGGELGGLHLETPAGGPLGGLRLGEHEIEMEAGG